ncbi:MAG: hypothetical protein R2867_05285 [Caldilineaceae bacterium]
MRELSRHDESGDVAALATDLGSLIGTWQTLRESLLTDQIADGRGDVVDAREKIASADAAIQRFRRQANDLTEILSGLSLPLVTTGDGQQSGLGSLILDLVGSMSESHRGSWMLRSAVATTAEHCGSIVADRADAGAGQQSAGHTSATVPGWAADPDSAASGNSLSLPVNFNGCAV